MAMVASHGKKKASLLFQPLLMVQEQIIMKEVTSWFI